MQFNLTYTKLTIVRPKQVIYWPNFEIWQSNLNSSNTKLRDTNWI